LTDPLSQLKSLLNIVLPTEPPFIPSERICGFSIWSNHYEGRDTGGWVQRKPVAQTDERRQHPAIVYFSRFVRNVAQL
jgi:hypothetical protein